MSFANFLLVNLAIHIGRRVYKGAAGAGRRYSASGGKAQLVLDCTLHQATADRMLRLLLR
jgi:hypothetical protein